MSSGTFSATVHCPTCGYEYAGVHCAWWYHSGSREEPPDGSLEMLGLPTNDLCVNCGDDWTTPFYEKQFERSVPSVQSAPVHYVVSVDSWEIMYAEAEQQQPDEEDAIPFEEALSDEDRLALEDEFRETDTHYHHPSSPF